MLIEEAIKDVVLRLNNINWFENNNIKADDFVKNLQ